MMIEAMVRWTEMRIKPTDPEEAKYKRLMEGETQADFTPEFYHQFAPMVFDLSDVSRFNKSHDRGSTTLRFTDGDVCVVDITYEDFRNLYMQQTGVHVHTTITRAQEAAANKPAKPTPDQSGISNADEFNIDGL